MLNCPGLLTGAVLWPRQPPCVTMRWLEKMLKNNLQFLYSCPLPAADTKDCHTHSFEEDAALGTRALPPSKL